MRTFIAINLPDEVKKYLLAVIADLKSKNQTAQVKWVEDENLHLTLFFLGELDEDQLLNLVKSLNETIKFPKFHLTLESIGAFPSEQNPRIIKVSLSKSSELDKIVESLTKVIRSLSLPIDEKPFNSHVTLGRVKIPGKIKGLKNSKENLSFDVVSVELMGSELFDSGPRYSIIKSYSLN